MIFNIAAQDDQVPLMTMLMHDSTSTRRLPLLLLLLLLNPSLTVFKKHIINMIVYRKSLFATNETCSLLCHLTRISYRRWTRATRCLSRIVLYTEADAQCDKLHVVKLVSRTLTVASILKLVRPTPSVHLCRTKNQLDMLNRFNTIPACGRQTDRQTDSGLVRCATNKTRSPVSLGKLAS